MGGVASAGCSAVTVTWLGDSISNKTCPNSYTITRKYQAIDGGGNAVTCQQMITVKDTTAPVWTTVAGSLDRVLQCSDTSGLTVAQALSPVATDNCSGAITYTKMSGSFVAGSCPNSGTYTNTWTAKDTCNNTNTFTQVIAISDTTRPVLTCPTVPTVCQVDSNSYTIPPLVASDNCGGTLTITYSITGATPTRSGTGVNASGIFSPGVSTITWTVTDACGNISTCSTTVTINPKPIITTIYHN